MAKLKYRTLALRDKRRLLAFGLCVLAAGAITLMPLQNLVQAKQTAAIALPQAGAQQLPGSFADLVQKVKPAVVNISTTGKVRSRGQQFHGSPQPELEEFFQRFFGQRLPGSQAPVERKMHALGSGFIVSADGYIVTNNHVVSRADEITVILDDGTRLPAELKAVDQKTDLALLKVAADKELPFVAFGDSEKSRVGDWVIAIGNPFGLGGTTTTGIISARGRDLNSGPLDDFIQVDAPINQGNSGGPLFNLQGQVIGINTAIFSPNGGSVGIGFAIPSSIGANVVAQLQADGKVSRGWLGVQIQQVSEDIAATLDLDKSRGALVAKVVTDSPASKAGVLAGDVILSFDGQAVENMKELPKIVANTAANKTVAMEIWRNGSKQIIEVVTGVSQPEQLAAAQQPAANKAKLGLELAQLTPELRQRYQLDRKIEGVLITGVEPQSPAAENGLRGGDVIKMVGRTQVSSPGEVLDEINRISEASRKAVLLLVSRGGNDRFVALEIV